MRDLIDYQEQYKNQPFERYQVFFRKKKIIEILLKTKHDNLLEIGCGLDSIFNDIDSFQKLFVIEPSQLFCKKAVSDLIEHKQKKNITVINKLIEESIDKLKSINFDFILISCLLHEVSDPKNLLSSIYAITQPNTIIHINVPNAKSFHRLLAVEMGIIEDIFQKSQSNIQFQQHTVFDMNSLIDLVETSGFYVVDSGSYSFKPFTHLQMENMLQANLITEAMFEGFYKMEKYLPDLGSEIYLNIKRK